MKKYKRRNNKIIELENQKIRIVNYANGEYALEIKGTPNIVYAPSRGNENLIFKEFLQNLFKEYTEVEFNVAR